MPVGSSTYAILSVRAYDRQPAMDQPTGASREKRARTTSAECCSPCHGQPSPAGGAGPAAGDDRIHVFGAAKLVIAQATKRNAAITQRWSPTSKQTLSG